MTMLKGYGYPLPGVSENRSGELQLVNKHSRKSSIENLLAQVTILPVEDGQTRKKVVL